MLTMIVLALALYANSLLPVRADRWESWDVGWSHRLALATAVSSVTDEPEEQLTLMSLARYESNYRKDVADCVAKGPDGEVTAWQILSRGPKDDARLCQTYEGDARVALERLRESTRACRHLPPDRRLGIYTRGRCDSVVGQRLSQHRYPGTNAVGQYKALMSVVEK